MERKEARVEVEAGGIARGKGVQRKVGRASDGGRGGHVRSGGRRIRCRRRIAVRERALRDGNDLHKAAAPDAAVCHKRRISQPALRGVRRIVRE